MLRLILVGLSAWFALPRSSESLEFLSWGLGHYTGVEGVWKLIVLDILFLSLFLSWCFIFSMLRRPTFHLILLAFSNSISSKSLFLSCCKSFCMEGFNDNSQYEMTQFSNVLYKIVANLHIPWHLWHEPGKKVGERGKPRLATFPC